MEITTRECVPLLIHTETVRLVFYDSIVHPLPGTSQLEHEILPDNEIIRAKDIHLEMASAARFPDANSNSDQLQSTSSRSSLTVSKWHVRREHKLFCSNVYSTIYHLIYGLLLGAPLYRLVLAHQVGIHTNKPNRKSCKWLIRLIIR